MTTLSAVHNIINCNHNWQETTTILPMHACTNEHNNYGVDYAHDNNKLNICKI